jgi:hypothetical protein
MEETKTTEITRKKNAGTSKATIFIEPLTPESKSDQQRRGAQAYSKIVKL